MFQKQRTAHRVVRGNRVGSLGCSDMKTTSNSYLLHEFPGLGHMTRTCWVTLLLAQGLCAGLTASPLPPGSFTDNIMGARAVLAHLAELRPGLRRGPRCPDITIQSLAAPGEAVGGPCSLFHLMEEELTPPSWAQLCEALGFNAPLLFFP